MKKRLFILFLLAALILYILFFPQELQKEISFQPKWYTSLDSDYYTGDPVGRFHFQVNDDTGRPYLGYIGEGGELLFREPVHYRAAVSDEGFINYSAFGGSLVLQDSTGMVMDICETNGFPLLEEDWFLIISSDRKGISLLNWEGEQLWQNHFGSIITALDLNESGILLGFLNGEVIFLNRAGETVFKREHRDMVIYGCALSYMDGGFAVISGLAPQKLLLYTFEASEVNLLWERELAEESRTTRQIGFSEDNRYLYAEESGGLVFYDLTGFEWGEIELAGRFLDGVIRGEGELTSFFAGNSDKYSLKILEFGGEFGMDIEFPRDSTIVHIDARSLVASAPGGLFRIDREMF